MNGKSLMTLLLHIPPLAEQKRIAARLEEIIPKIGEFQEAEEKITKLNATFPASFKKSILQSAIQGKLVPQDPDEEPASVLLQKIRKEREKLIKSDKINQPKTESFIFRRAGSWWEKRGKEKKCIDAEILLRFLKAGNGRGWGRS